MKYNIYTKFLTGIITMIIIVFNIKYITYARTEINFNNITIKEGLPQGTVETMFQDSEGYIWFGTNDGLARYNGYEFYVYAVEEDGINSLSNNYILDIKEDKYNNIWVGTASGLSKIHKDRKTIKNYSVDNGNLSHNNVASILITKNDEILIATPDGLNLYNESTDSFTRIFDKEKLVDQYINSLTEDNQGNVWVGTEGGISKINLKDDTSKNFVHDDENKNSISSNEIYKVYYDSKGYIWGGTYNSGAFKINLDNYEVTRYFSYENDDKSLGGNYIKNFLRDSNGDFWIGTDKGLSKYNEEDDKFITYSNKIYDLNSLVNNNIFSIMEDSTGLIWVGTYSGVSMFNPNNKIEHYKNDPFNNETLTNNMVSTIYEDSYGALWIGTKGGGVDIFSKEMIKEVNIHCEDDESSILSNRVNYITGEKNTIFIGSDEGLSIIDTTNNSIVNYSEIDGLPSRNIKHLLYDDGYLWISTTAGLAILDIKKNEIINLANIINKYSPNDNYVQAVFKDSLGEYWVGMFIEGGLLRINPKKNEIKVYKTNENIENSISNNSIRSISEDCEGNIWVGTSLGLNKLNKESEKFVSYTTKDGLANNTIYGILIDNGGNPWISTNKGISKIDIRTNYVTNLTILDGLQSNEFNGQAYFENNKGEFYFGGVNGFNIIRPQVLEKEINIGDISFYKFEVNGLEVDDINLKSFKSTENNIHIEVFLPNYNNIENIKYYYKLGGGNSEWILMDGNVITLSNMSPGKYTFQAVATVFDGNSNAIDVEFVVNPPWWMSEEAILFYSLFIIVYIFYNRNAVVKLDKLVAERTKELSSEMEKNEKLFNKVIELEKRKNTYLINMSHELRTPLNVIHSTEQLIRALNKTEKGIEKENLNHYMSVMRNNVTRLLKIINDLIDTSKIEYGNYVLNFEKLDIVYLVEETTLSLKSLMEKKRIELIIDPEIEEKIIEGDRVELERCIVNIVGNAIKYSQEEGRIEVSVSEYENIVKIEIIDNGAGIDKKYHEVIFNRFNQVVDNNSEVKGGSGLGLTITKKIIELHKGDIYVESEIDKGSKFVIILPVSQKI